MVTVIQFAILFAFLTAIGAQAQAVDEYRVKAAFLFNFAKFVEWPAEAFDSAEEPIGICVLGQNPFGSVLEETVRGKVVANRTFVVRQISNAGQTNGCHIVFISALEGKHPLPFLEDLAKKRILTVSETDGTNAYEGVIGLSLRDGRVRIEIDPAAAGRAKLRISSKLLSLAEIKKP